MAGELMISNKPKTIIALDVDDVIIDLVTECLRQYNVAYDDRLKPEDITEWNISKFVKPECGTKIYDYLLNPDIYTYCNPVVNSMYGVNFLKTLGYRVIYVTVNNFSEAKSKWLINYGYMENMKDFVMTGDKSLVNANIMIDDNPDNLTNFIGLGIVYSKPWNKSNSCFLRVFNWDDIIERFTSIL